jgi:hypothetical protein
MEKNEIALMRLTGNGYAENALEITRITEAGLIARTYNGLPIGHPRLARMLKVFSAFVGAVAYAQPAP